MHSLLFYYDQNSFEYCQTKKHKIGCNLLKKNLDHKNKVLKSNKIFLFSVYIFFFKFSD